MMSLENNVSVRQVLLQAADLIETGWHQGSMAVDATGKPVFAVNPQACRFCMLGAMTRAAYELCNEQNGFAQANLVSDAMETVRPLLPGFSLSMFNDRQDQTAENVARVLRQAAEVSDGNPASA
jgi:hypothetical protein